MTNRMTYNGNADRLECDDEYVRCSRRITGIRDGVGFYADTVGELRAAFRESVDDYIETCAKIGKELKRPGRRTNQSTISRTT